MSAINVLFSALFAAGLFAIVMGLGIRRPVSLSELEKLSGRGEIRRGPWGRLQHELDTARLGVSAGEFLRVSIVLALLGGGAMYLLSNAPLAAVLGLVFGGLVYWIYLGHKAERAIEAYENALPSVVARLVAGARMGGSLKSAAAHAAEFGPEICREDWAYLAAQLDRGAEFSQACNVIAARRGSVLLDTIFELLVVQQQRGASLARTLEGIEESLRDRVRMMRKARTALGQPIRELWIVCAVPFVSVVFLRVVAPGYAAVYGTLGGQIILLLGWGLTLGGFALGYRSFSRSLRQETDFGGLGAEARGRLRTQAEIEKEKRQAEQAQRARERGAAPAALSPVTRVVPDPGRTP